MITWRDKFETYDKQVEFAKRVLGIRYEPEQQCVNCVINHVLNKQLAWKVQCEPIPAGTFDVVPRNEQDIIELAQEYPYYFVKYILKVEPRSFQKEFLSCTAQRKVLRIQRRAGKSHAMAMYALWYQLTHPKSRVRIVAPRETQVKELFEKMNDMIIGSSILINSVIKRNSTDGVLYRRNPNLEFKFTNGSTIRGITTGDGDGTSVRSQSADLLILDEMDFISEEQFAAIYPLIATSSNTELIQSSTPSGHRSYFYQWCHDPQYQEMHRRYHDLDIYSSQTDEEFKRNMPKDKYDREVLAEFTLQESGVFPNEMIDRQLEDYEFDNVPPPPGIYTFGIDWNESVQGVHIVIVRYEPHHNKYRVSNVVVVPPSEFTQIVQVNKIVELYELYRPRKIVMDEGFGMMQIQALRQWGVQNNDEEFLNQIETVHFGKTTDVYDPLVGTYEKVPVKDFMVSNAKRMLENDKLILPRSQDIKSKLVGQMRSYVVEKVLDNGIIKYSKGNVHTLEQLLLALFGMYLIKEELMNANVKVLGIVQNNVNSEQIGPVVSSTIRQVSGYHQNRSNLIGKLYKGRYGL